MNWSIFKKVSLLIVILLSVLLVVFKPNAYALYVGLCSFIVSIVLLICLLVGESRERTNSYTPGFEANELEHVQA